VVPEQTATLRGGPQTPSRETVRQKILFSCLSLACSAIGKRRNALRRISPATARPDQRLVIGRLRKRLHRVSAVHPGSATHGSVAIREGALRTDQLRGLAETNAHTQWSDTLRISTSITSGQTWLTFWRAGAGAPHSRPPAILAAATHPAVAASPLKTIALFGGSSRIDQVG